MNFQFSIYCVFSFLLLIYMLWPGPSSIKDFSDLPDSEKSQLPGDTWQIPNVAAYFSNNFRDFVVPFYLKDYRAKSHLPFPPLRLNYPPEYSWTAIRKQTETTYLEELVYPLRDSLYINGYEIYYPDGTPVFYSAPKLQSDKPWYTKTTLRLYTSSIFARIIVWFGILLSIIFIYRLGREIIKE